MSLKLKLYKTIIYFYFNVLQRRVLGNMKA
jgi:hypothetical protein